MPQIKTKYMPNGKLEREAQGFQGEACRQATLPFLLSQPGRVVCDTPTAEAEQSQVWQIDNDNEQNQLKTRQ